MSGRSVVIEGSREINSGIKLIPSLVEVDMKCH